MNNIITHSRKVLLFLSGKTISFDALINQANEAIGAFNVTLSDAGQV